MVQKVTIENFKSIQYLELELGRVNVLIGENGSGKSNILEAIAMGSAAAEDKLENQFLASRGIRTTDPKAMRAGFEKENSEKSIKMTFDTEELRGLSFELKNDNTPFSEWVDLNKKIEREHFSTSFENFLEQDGYEANNLIKYNVKLTSFKPLIIEPEDSSDKAEASSIDMINSIIRKVLAKKNTFKNFLIFAPENHFLRRFEEESQIEPLGIRGEGLFKFISTLSYEKPELLQKIIENLELIDWFEGFEIPTDLRFTERRIKIKDRFIEEGLTYFDQRSSNEGFLYLLFYFSLFVSDYTPHFFAIDNIDNAMNPKLVTRLIQQLAKMAKEHNKQIILTTHNPAVLDGLDLKDDEQRLFVVSRNALGHTKTLRITHKPASEGQEPVKLSEQFLRGYIGGLPKNF